MLTYSRHQQQFPPLPRVPRNSLLPSLSLSSHYLSMLRGRLLENILLSHLSTWVCLQNGDPHNFALWLGIFIMISQPIFGQTLPPRTLFLEIPGPCHGTRSVGMSKWHGCILLVSPKLLDPGHPWAPQKKPLSPGSVPFLGCG